jgi:hypothetical protein
MKKHHRKFLAKAVFGQNIKKSGVINIKNIIKFTLLLPDVLF